MPQFPGWLLSFKQPDERSASINKAAKWLKYGQHTNRGWAYHYLKQYEQAISDYSRALALKPTYGKSLVNRGIAYYDLKRYTEALAEYEQALAIDLTEERRTQYSFGLTYFTLKNYQKAIAACSRTIELDPNNWQAYNNRGLCYQAQKDFSTALADFEQAISISLNLNDSEALAPYVNRAWIYAERGDYQLAFDDCNYALQLGMKDQVAYAARARVYCWQGEYEMALADCARSLEIDPECDDAYGVRGLVAYAQQRYEDALADFEKALELGHNLFWLEKEYETVRASVKGKQA